MSDNAPCTRADGFGEGDWTASITFAAGFATLIQFLRGIRPPGSWAVTQLQLDYTHGFIKRGLPGTVLNTLGFAVEDHQAALVIGVVLTVGAFASMGWLFHRSGITRSLRGAGVALVAGSTFAVALLAHLAGYYDHVVITLAALLLGTVVFSDSPRASRIALPMCVVFGVLAVLSHEMFLVLGAPSICLAFWLRRRPVHAVAFGALMLAATTFVTTQGTVERETVIEMVHEDDSATNFTVMPATYRVLRRSPTRNVAKRMQLHRRGRTLRILGSLVVFLPTALFMVFIAVRRLHADLEDEPALHRSGAIALALASAFGPLVLHLFGWDFHRFNALTVVGSAMTIAVVFRFTAKRPWSHRERSILTRVGAILVIVNLTAGVGFFDPYRPQPFPFESHVNALIEAAK